MLIIISSFMHIDIRPLLILEGINGHTCFKEYFLHRLEMLPTCCFLQIWVKLNSHFGHTYPYSGHSNVL